MPAKKYRIAVIGHTGRGDYGHGLDTCWLSMPETEIVAVADPHDGGRANAQKRTRAPKAFADYREMLEAKKPDIAVIGPRHLDQHHDMFLECAKRGIHAFMEKPMCPTLTEADAMVAAGEKNRVKLALAHQTRYCPRLAMVRKLIEDGAIGKLLELRGRGKEDSRRGGGEDTWVLGSHIMNLIYHLAGEPNWCFAEALQDGRRVTKADVKPGNEGIGPLAADAIHARYGLDNGVTASFDSVRGTGTGRPWRFGLQIFGSKGVLEILTGYMTEVFYLPDPSWSPGRSGKKWLPVTSAGIDKPEPFKGDSRLAGNVEVCRDLIAAIEQDRQPECSASEGRWTVEMIAAIFESHRHNAPIEFPLKTRVNPLTLL